MRSLRWGWIVFGVSALVIFGSAPFLASSAEDIAEQTGVSESFFGVLAVAFVTTLPELTTSAAALRLGARDLAVANIFGTNAFNILVLGIADPFFTQGSFFASVDDSHVGTMRCRGTSCRRGERSTGFSRYASPRCLAVSESQRRRDDR